MKIIDSHVHFWNPSQLQYDWLADVPAINRSFLPSDYLETTKGLDIQGIVFVQADCIAEQGLQEVDWVCSLDAPIKAIVAFAALEKGDAVRAELEQVADKVQVKGVRRLIQSEATGFATQANFIKAVQALPEYKLSFDICIFHHQLPDVIELVRQCPKVDFVLDHVGKPAIANGEIEHWRANIQALAEFPNVSCKISGMVTEANHKTWIINDLQPYIDHIISSFGIQRLMFGSDWPVVNLAASYQKWVKALEATLKRMSENERNLFLSENAHRFYRIRS